MAFKNRSKLTGRNKSSLRSQLSKLITYYGSIIIPRERVYLKNLGETDGNIYWVEDKAKKLIAVALVDSNYIFEASGFKLLSLGHTISMQPGQMGRLLDHIFTDHNENSLVMLCRHLIAESVNFIDLGLYYLTPTELLEFWPELARFKTDYFNVKNEALFSGLSRKQYNLYFKFSAQDKKNLEANHSNLWTLLRSKQV